jgi:hypothetical protein
MRVTGVDLRRKARDVFAALDRNETVTLVYRGKVKGVIVPVSGAKAKLKCGDHPAFGMWRDREDMSDVEAYVRRIRRPRHHVAKAWRRTDPIVEGIRVIRKQIAKECKNDSAMMLEMQRAVLRDWPSKMVTKSDLVRTRTVRARDKQP